jgi:hypothetical protein
MISLMRLLLGRVLGRGGRALGAATGLSLLSLVACLAAAGEPAPAISVRLDTDRLSVEAAHATVSEIIEAIGAQAGFAVVMAGPSATVEHFSHPGGSVEDVLRHLLRSENYALVYREGAGESGREIDTVLLLGQRRIASPEAPADLVSAGRRARPGDAAEEALHAAAPPAPDPGRTAVGAPDAEDDGHAPVTADDVLRVHALSAPPAIGRPGGMVGASPASRPGGADDLAAITRIAQRNLKAVIDGLATAERTLPVPRGASPAR